LNSTELTLLVFVAKGADKLVVQGDGQLRRVRKRHFPRPLVQISSRFSVGVSPFMPAS
jgi:hypothetical protein